MALRFIDSFDSYSMSDLPSTGNFCTKWTTFWVSNSAADIFTGPGRFGNAARFRGNQGVFLIKAFSTAQPTWIIGFALRFNGVPSSNFQIVKFMDSNSRQIELNINSSGFPFFTRNGTTIGSVSATGFAANVWYYVEWYGTIASSLPANGCNLNINGVNVITVPTATNTQNTSNASANQIWIGCDSGLSATMDIDDLYICDATGSSPTNTFLGDVRVESRVPTSSGSLTGWSPSSGTPLSCISEQIFNGDQNYIYSSTTNDIASFITAPLLSTPSTIFGVQISHVSRKSDAGTRQVQDVLREAGTTYPGTIVNLSTSYTCFSTIYPLDPATSSAWSLASVNALEIGIKEVT